MGRILGVLVLVIGVLSFLFWPTPKNDQELIKESLFDIVRGVGDQKSKVVLAQISTSYTDQTGWSKKSIRGILFQQFQQKDSFTLQITPTKFIVTPPTAEVQADVIVFGGSMWNPNSETMEFDVVFRYQKEEDGVWRMTGHSRSER